MGVSQTTVVYIKKRLGLDPPRPKDGPRPKLSDREKRLAAALVTRGEAQSATQATRLLNRARSSTVSVDTVRRALKERNLVAKKKVKKPALSLAHRRARLRWAHTYREWTVEDWSRVIWSDETKINRFHSDGLQMVWVPKGEGLTPRTIKPTVKFGGGGIMVWGCMTWFGVGKLGKVQGLLDAKQFIEILDANLVPTLDAAICHPSIPSGQLYFQQDNDPKHTSRVAKSWFEGKKIKVLPWPAQSPDLNPIEHLWSHLKRKLASHKTVTRGTHELWDRVSEDWLAISIETCQGLISSMPRRIEAVIKAKGGQTRY